MDAGRRRAIKRVGGVALAAGLTPLLSSCTGPVRSARSGGDEQVPGLDPILADVLYHASLAPSGHNTQPWTVSVPEPNRLLIGTAPDRWLPKALSKYPGPVSLRMPVSRFVRRP